MNVKRSIRYEKKNIQYSWVIGFILMISCAPQVFGFSKNRPSMDDKFIEIHMLQDERNMGGIRAFYTHEDPDIREVAYKAMASIQDTLFAEDLFDGLMTDPVSEVRIAAAYALGQTTRLITRPDPTYEVKLIKLIATDKDPRVVRELFICLGTISRQPETSFLTNYRSTDPIILEGIAWGIYRAGLNEGSKDGLVKRAFELLQRDMPASVRLAAAQFFARTKDISIDAYADALLQMTSTEINPDTRMALVLALGKLKDGGGTRLLTSIIESDTDDRVRINAIRSFSKIGGLTAENQLRPVLQDPRVNVSVAAAEHFENVNQIFFPAEIRRIADVTTQWRVRTVLYKSLLKQKFEIFSISQNLRDRYKQSENTYERAWILDALSVAPDNISFIRTEIFQSDIPVIRTYGMDGLCGLIQSDRLDPSVKSRLVEIMKDAISHEDAVMVSLAAGVFANPELNLKEIIQDTTFLHEALMRLNLPQDYEAAQEIIQAIKYLDGSELLNTMIKLDAQPINWTVLNRLTTHPKAKIQTDRGEITIELFKFDAPGTVANFVELSRKGFYDGKYFHRVVPNFVIQAGCPRGDGWGSSDAIIRSEFSQQEFDTGYMGMASSGKDTESCQWFITQSPTPHLNGRYTIFARVVEGMDVVNQIQVGDKIQFIHIR